MKYINKIRIFVKLLLVTLTTQSIYAQDIKHTIINLSTNSGLSQNNIISIYQDKSNFLWIGTNEGLNKDDSYNFTNFLKNNKENSISNNTIWAIDEDKFGNILIGTREGLNVYNPVNGEFTIHKNEEGNKHSLSHNNIRTIATFDSANYWLGTNYGLNKINLKNGECNRFFHEKDNSNSISNNTVISLYADKNEILWIGTRNGLNRFDTKSNTFKHFNYSPTSTNTICGNNIRNIIKDTSGMLWVATENGISNLQEDSMGNFIISSYSAVNKDISLKDVSVIEDIGNNMLFIGTINTGAYIFNTNTNSFVLKRAIFKRINNIRTALSNKAGILWVGTSNSGLYKIIFPDKIFEHKQIKDQNNNSIMFYSFFEDKNNIIYCGTTNGIVKYNRQTKDHKTFQIEKSIRRENTIRAITSINKNKLIIGTYKNGLWLFDTEKETFTQHEFNTLFPESKQIMQIHKKNNNLFILSNEGTFYYYSFDKNKFEKHSIKSNAALISFFEYQKDKYLIGTLSDGLWYYNNKTKQSKKIKFDNININTVTGIVQNSKKEIFLSTFGNGLLKISGNDLNRITTFPEIKAGDIYGLLFDEDENLWFGTNTGLFKFNPDNNNILNYHYSDGLQGEEFNSGAYLKCSDGEMFFGGVSGFNHFKPSEIKENKNKNKVILTDLRILNNSVSPNDTINNRVVLEKNIQYTEVINLDYKDYYFSLHFACVDFNNLGTLKYRYKLDGYDETWTTANADTRSATYRNMPAGEYIFKVQVTDYTGNWSEKEASIKINIKPPFWKTKIFYILIIIFIISIIITYTRLRVHQLRKDKVKLEKTVSKRTIELKRSNNKLENYKEHLEEIVNERTIELKNQNEEYLTLNEEYQQQNKEFRKAKEKAEESDKLKTAFLANMSHEIRTPMNAIIGFSQFLNNDLTKKEKGEYIKIIQSSGDTLLHLIDDIIDIAKIEAGQLTMMNTAFNVDEVINEIHNSFSTSKNNEKLLTIELINSVPDNLNPRIYTDEHRFRQILNNLISNALKFTEKGYIEVGYFINNTNSDFVTFFIKDTGIGIPENEQAGIFKRFSKIDENRTNIYRGTGLGLAISKNIIELSGGKIWFESKEKKGTTFFFTLPLYKE